MVADYPINMNHQSYETACVGGRFQEMIKEYAEEAEYGLKYAKNEIAEICASIFDFDQTEVLDEIISEGMKSTSDDSCFLEELIDTDDIINDSPACKNNIETPKCDDSDDLKKYLNNEMLILQEGKGSQQMIEAEKSDDIETFISSILESWNQESTEMSCLQKL